MKKIGIILIAMLILFSASAAGLNIKSLENKSNNTTEIAQFDERILISPLEFGSIRNNSTTTLCAEEDNINIPLYYQKPTAYRIIATHPTYLPTNVVDQGENWTNCHFADNKDSTETVVMENVTMYDDGNVVIEAVKLSSWWRNGESMDVSIKGAQESNVTYFIIYKLIPGSNMDFPQVFVLYEDGNSRLIPQPPTYLRMVTFGSSVIIGATENIPRPFTDIDFVEIDPLNLSMNIIYGDRTSAHVALQVDRNQNIIEVSNITYDTSNHPFARFRSMWVKDGNADIDHVRTQEGVFPIMGGWTQLNGTSWEFIKEIPTIHNTYCPDIKIEVIESNAS